MKHNGFGGTLRRFFKKNGLYLALCGCVVGAALLSYNAAGRLMQQLFEAPAPITQQQSDAPQLSDRENEPVLEDVVRPRQDLPVQQQETEAAARDDVLFEPVYCAPVAGSIIAPFSNYELVKNESMNDWRTHNGVDIAAEEGTEAVAVYAGVVSGTADDPLWGGTVTLKLDTGYEVTYAGLGEIAVQEGQRISQRQLLGTVGSAPAESKMPSHLHFEVKSGISYIDPEILLGS